MYALHYGSDSFVFLQVSTTGVSTSSALSLLIVVPNKMPGGEVHLLLAILASGLPPHKGRQVEVCDARMCSTGVALGL